MLMNRKGPKVQLQYMKTRALGASRRTSPSRPVSVLIADDDPEFSAALSELIASQRALLLVGAAVDTGSAVALCKEQNPDVAIVDLRMPGGGGIPAARQIARACPRTKVIALSAYRDPRSVKEMVDAGAVEYLVKGADSSVEIVEAILRAASLASTEP